MTAGHASFQTNHRFKNLSPVLNLEMNLEPALNLLPVALVLLLLLQPWNDFMNCTGEEQERLLSLLEKEDASKKNTNRLHKDHENGECFQLRLCLFVCLLLSSLFSLTVSLSSVHSK